MYQELNNFENRVKESRRINVKYPDRIPCIIQKEPNSTLSSIKN